MSERYMVIERFREGGSAAVYQRFAEKGRMLSDGLVYLDSWLTEGGDTCFQLMEADNAEHFDKWVVHWDDLVDFEIIRLKPKPTGEFKNG